MRFIKFEHTQEHRDRAIALADDFGKTTHPNHAGGNSRAQGMLAEIVFTEVYALAMRDTQFKQDYKLGDHLINVKSNSCRVYPQAFYDVTVFCCDLPRLNHRGVDLVFVKLSFDAPHIAYIVGWLPLPIFRKQARLIHKGERFGHNGICFADCLAMRIEQLNSIDELRTDGDLFAGEFCLPL